MRLTDFDYSLPTELIAQRPADRRDASRLMILDRATGTVGETTFPAISGLFREGDLLVINDTRVIPARLIGVKETGGRVEIFLVKRLLQEVQVWECLLKCSKKPCPGSVVILPGGVTARIEGRDDTGHWTVSFSPAAGFEEWLEQTGSVPLPPYIRRPAFDEDRERYQTVFARVKGAVAAPTAGLHFTAELLDELRRKGVDIVPLTLHVGLGTFLPVRVENPGEHRMHREYFSIPDATASAIDDRKRGKGRVIALGTTATRALEHAAEPDGTVRAGEGEADIFICPGYSFKVIDGLITNFHLPCSTLLMLVAAFAGRDFVMRAYEEAVAKRFRFFSYGDAMMIL
ncbi:MAG TPA: tRNA preQ1(34) S-adenosylmethionine ribosyltransferase-isomerase QueA [Geobacteraceae bacterium]|nr:tRNA preQ1(34) S-adenosylmethionine ribosyltransferase-isomerase QueA [Geobacteraceae bacterium]